MPDELAELIAERFRVIGEPMRIKLLDCLREQVCGSAQRQLAEMSTIVEQVAR